MAYGSGGLEARAVRSASAIPREESATTIGIGSLAKRLR